MRYFNTYGPVNEREHYVVPRQSLVDELITQIERGTYFTIFAPRQMGKTTLLRALSDLLQSRNAYLALALNFEAYEGWTNAVNLLYALTTGHPFLVNQLAAIVTEEIATDRTVAITEGDIDTAQRKLVRETNYNFETLGRHTREHPDEILAILFGSVIPFNLNIPLVSTLYMQGIISESPTESCQIANPIYRQVLIAYLRPLNFGLQGDLLANGFDFRKLVTAGSLDLKAILSNFRPFVERRGKEAFKVSPMPQEATGQYMLMAYLDSVLRQIGGVVYTEVPSGDGRLDLIVVFQDQRYVIETKIWRGAAYFDRGLEQMQQYLTSEGVREGYYVLFHARPNVYGQLDQEELEYTKTIAQTDIHV